MFKTLCSRRRPDGRASFYGDPWFGQVWGREWMQESELLKNKQNTTVGALCPDTWLSWKLDRKQERKRKKKKRSDHRSATFAFVVCDCMFFLHFSCLIFISFFYNVSWAVRLSLTLDVCNEGKLRGNPGVLSMVNCGVWLVTVSPLFWRNGSPLLRTTYYIVKNEEKTQTEHTPTLFRFARLVLNFEGKDIHTPSWGLSATA